MSIEEFRKAWYLAHVSHAPNIERDKKSKHWRRTVLTARTWEDVIARTKGEWLVAALSRCLPHQL